MQGPCRVLRSRGNAWLPTLLYGEGDAWFARRRARHSVHDFDRIRNGQRRFTPEDSVALHEASREWLAAELAGDFDGPTVVVTHYLPARPSVAKRYADDPMNPAFASRLEDLIERFQPELWIHGHTHVACDYEIFGTRVVCNPRGYPTETSDRGFLPGLVVEL